MQAHELRALGCALLSLATGLSGTAAASDLVRVDGVLGGSVTYQLVGAPALPFVLAPSFSVGPTPLALLDPGDGRELDVGLDLLAFWTIGGLDAGGAGSVTYPLPALPGLAGLTLFAQFVELPFFPTTFGAISDRARQIDKAAALAESGDTEAANALLSQPPEVTEPLPPPPLPAELTAPVVAGISKSSVWEYEVEDLLALVKQVAAGNAPVSLLCVDTVKLRAFIRSTDGQMQLDGVRIFQKKTISGRV